MTLGLVIFDCDGVLVDSEILSAEVEAEALRGLGVAISNEEALQLFLGLTQADGESLVERRFGLSLPPDHALRTAERLTQVYKERLKPIPGVHDLIGRLAVPFCVASNSPPAKLGLGLSLTDLFESFYPHVFCAKLVGRGKPAPDLFLHAAKVLGVAPAATVVVEDSVTGITAAKAAGMTAIGFVGGLHHRPPSPQRLRAAGADHVAQSMEEVGRLLGL
jgi:HAD superfamily hydrolase (TIGR01509 family)